MSFLLGAVTYLIVYCDLLYWIIHFISFKKLDRQIEPPNIYAALLDPRYNEDIRGRLVRIYFPYEGKKKRGIIEFASVKGAERAVWVINIEDVDENHEVLKTYPEEFRILLYLDQLDFQVEYLSFETEAQVQTKTSNL
ncbi:MAG: hypothetical protein ACM3UW_05430 [Bacillota bacterium]